MKRLRRLIAWLALSGVAFGGFWPLIATAQPASTVTSLVICTQSGFQTIALDADGKLVPGKGHSNATHCPLCLGLLDHAMPASHVPGVVVAATAAYDIVAPSERAPRSRAAQLHPPSRAPPAHSPALA